jgi:hypothetical protein
MKLSELEINKILIDKEINLSSTILRKYLKSIQKENHMDKTKNLPIFFPTALIFGEIFKNYSLPDGTIHLSQKIVFTKPIQRNANIHAFAKINKNTIRAGKRLISIKINIYNDNSILHESDCNLLVS